MIESTIRDFITKKFRPQAATAFDDDSALFTSGIVDSFGVLELIAFLEESFGIEIDTGRHELTEFDTVRKIAALVERLQRPGA